MKAKRLREEQRKPPLDVGSWGFLWWSPLSLPRLAVFSSSAPASRLTRGQTNSPTPLPAKPGNGQRNTAKSAWFNPLEAKHIDAYIILSALVAWRNFPAASIGQFRHPSYNYWPNLDTDVPTLSSICDFTILATPASCSMKREASWDHGHDSPQTHDSIFSPGIVMHFPPRMQK